MKRFTSFKFRLEPTHVQLELLCRHAGASRFAYNQLLASVKRGIDAKKSGEDVKIPRTGFDLINAFNAWKNSEAAGVDENGRVGLPWRSEVSAQVFEEAAIDLGRAFEGFWKGKTGERKGSRPLFPVFKKRGRDRSSFRMRNKNCEKKASIRIEEDAGSWVIRLPKIGTMKLSGRTRSLRRMIAKQRAKILFATIFERAGRWYVSLNVEAEPFHAAQATPERPNSRVGIDRGLNRFVVVSNAEGTDVLSVAAPKPLVNNLKKLQRLSRSASRKQKGSKNQKKAFLALGHLHERIRNIRSDFVHRLSSTLAKTHGELVIENLMTKGMIRNRRLSRAISDVAWGQLGLQLRYKAAWYGAVVHEAVRFFPSTKRCCGCGFVALAVPLSERILTCDRCGLTIDRDVNAARNLAVWPEVGKVNTEGACTFEVAAQQAETQNACGEGSSGSKPLRVKLASVKQEWPLEA